MNDHPALAPIAPVALPERLAVTVWDHPDGGYELWLDAIAEWAIGGTLAEAALALAEEVRCLADTFAHEPRYRDAPNWRRRGPFAVSLAMLSDAEIVARFDYRFDDEPSPHLDR